MWVMIATFPCRTFIEGYASSERILSLAFHGVSGKMVQCDLWWHGTRPCLVLPLSARRCHISRVHSFGVHLDSLRTLVRCRWHDVSAWCLSMSHEHIPSTRLWDTRASPGLQWKGAVVGCLTSAPSLGAQSSCLCWCGHVEVLGFHDLHRPLVKHSIGVCTEGHISTSAVSATWVAENKELVTVTTIITVPAHGSSNALAMMGSRDGHGLLNHP